VQADTAAYSTKITSQEINPLGRFLEDLSANSHVTTRREFLRGASAVSFGAAAAMGLAAGPAEAELQPVPREGSSRLKVSVNAFSFSRLLNDKIKRGKGGIDLFDLVDFCAKNNVDGFDPTGYFFPGFPAAPADDYLYNLKRHAFESGVGISGTGARNNFTTADKAQRTADVKVIKDWVICASKMGAPVLRVFADTQMRNKTWQDVAGGATREQVRDWIADDLRECTAFGKEHGVIIGVQNHGDFLRTADDLIELVGLVDSPWCGVIVDTGYFRSADPYKDMEKAAPYAVNWQVKQSPIGAESDVKLDLKRLLRIVRASDYSGYLPIETLSVRDKPYDPFQIVPQFVQELKQAIAETA
jgi:sugar phosphate isomerase/epimerase